MATLYVIATPLGNLEDFSARGVRVLGSVDVVACEDTRQSRKLLKHFGIDTKTTSYHEHNEEARTPQLIERLERGESVALVSDAGTPLLSDPGFRLVRACREKGIPVIPIPGPFAGAAAASVSGLPTDRILFVGFLSRRKSELEKQLEVLRSSTATLVFYLSPHRLERTLDHLCRVLGSHRKAFLIREMTKLFETSYFGDLDLLRRELAGETPPGEYTLVVAGLDDTSRSKALEIDAVAYVFGLMEFRKVDKKTAIKAASSELGIPKRDLYRLILEAGI